MWNFDHVFGQMPTNNGHVASGKVAKASASDSASAQRPRSALLWRFSSRWPSSSRSPVHPGARCCSVPAQPSSLGLDAPRRAPLAPVVATGPTARA